MAILATNARYAAMGIAFERKLLKALAHYGCEYQVPCAAGIADFVIHRPRRTLIEAKRTLRAEQGTTPLALQQAQAYADALGIDTIALVAQRLAAPPEAFGASDVLVDFDSIQPGINVILWRA